MTDRLVSMPGDGQCVTVLAMTPADAISPAGQSLFLGAGVFGTLAGIGFVAAGIRGRQIWFATWGGMLAIAGLAYLIASSLGY